MPRWITNAGYWLAYQARAWRWGAIALLFLAASVIIPAVLGSILFVALSWLSDGEPGAWTFGLCVTLCAPFGLHAYEGMVSGWRRSNPSPRESDLWLQQNGIKPPA